MYKVAGWIQDHDHRTHHYKTHDKNTHLRNTGRQRTRGKQAKREICLYIGIIAGEEKKYKKVKKNLEIRKNRRIFAKEIKNKAI